MVEYTLFSESPQPRKCTKKGLEEHMTKHFPGTAFKITGRNRRCYPTRRPTTAFPRMKAHRFYRYRRRASETYGLRTGSSSSIPAAARRCRLAGQPPCLGRCRLEALSIFMTVYCCGVLGERSAQGAALFSRMFHPQPRSQDIPVLQTMVDCER